MAPSLMLWIFWTLFISTTLNSHLVHCEETSKDETPSSSTSSPSSPLPVNETKSDKLEISTLIKKEPESTKKEKTVIIVAERVENPSNWNSWTPMEEKSTNLIPSSFIGPFSKSDVHRTNEQPPSASHFVKGAKKTKKLISLDKWGLEELFQSTFMRYGKMLYGNFMEGFGHNSDGHHGGGLLSLMDTISDFSGSFGSAQSGPHEHEGRSLMNWISRLIGVDGKSLGEFLREYQVHVLYDLVFTFFKWIFFLYAGLIIP